jgi:hypothetical protein
MLQLTNGNQLGFDEVVDTLSDALTVAEQIERAVADGIGLSDIGTLISVTPRLNEIRQDFPTFSAQLRDLSAEESALVEQELHRRHGATESKIIDKAVAALTLVSKWYGVTVLVVSLVQETIEYGRQLFPKKTEAAA